MDFVDIPDGDLEKTIAATLQPPLLIAFRRKGNTLCDNVEERLRSLPYEGRLRLGRMDVDTSPTTREQLGILSVPNLVLFKGSVELRAGWIGPWTKEKAPGHKEPLEEFLEKRL
jgi:thioredoxin-like negative regulator of GroEL